MKLSEQIPITEAARRYGLQVNPKGLALCPFHREKTPSFKLYKDGFHCFGCGAHGDVVTLTMELLHLTYRQAMARLDYDFHLGLNRPITIKERRQQDKRLQQLQEAKQRQNTTNRLYAGLAAEYRMLRQCKADYSPSSPQEPLFPLYVQAVKRLPYLDYIFSSLDTERSSLWNENLP